MCIACLFTTPFIIFRTNWDKNEYNFWRVQCVHAPFICTREQHYSQQTFLGEFFSWGKAKIDDSKVIVKNFSGENC